MTRLREMHPARPKRLSGPPSGAVLAFLLAALLAAACAPLPQGFTPPPGQGQVRGVPFHAQEDHQCGPASLAMVLNHLGDPATPEDISRAIYRQDLRGTLSLDLALYPRGRGHGSSFRRGAPQDLADAVNAGLPPLVMVNEGFGGIRVMHFMVITGYDGQGVTANSGRRQGLRLSWREFLSAWDGADRWLLLVTPGTAPAGEGK